MKTKTIGIVLLVVGIVGLIVVYSFRPPAGFGEALMMMGEGRQFYIKEPWHQIFLAVSVVISLFGVLRIVRAQKGNKEDKSSEGPGI